MPYIIYLADAFMLVEGESFGGIDYDVCHGRNYLCSNIRFNVYTVLKNLKKQEKVKAVYD